MLNSTELHYNRYQSCLDYIRRYWNRRHDFMTVRVLLRQALLYVRTCRLTDCRDLV